MTGRIIVSAATSLTGSFTELAEAFMEQNPDVEVVLNFDGSSTLASQILEGAAADVFASADETNMAKVLEEELVSGTPRIFARNELVIITKPGNPEAISMLGDLARAGVISLCGEEVPCGRYAAEALGKADVTIPEAQVTRGQNAGATLAAVADGDAVAGIVYVTDARAAAGRVDAVPMPAGGNVTASYPIGVLRDAGNAALADAFVAFVLGDEGQAVLGRHGFTPAP